MKQKKEREEEEGDGDNRRKPVTKEEKRKRTPANPNDAESDDDLNLPAMTTAYERLSSKKGVKKKKKEQMAKGDADLDEEPPEVFTMMQGKESAKKLMREERDNKIRIRKEAKRKQQARAAKRQGEKTASIEVDNLIPCPDGLLDDSIVRILSEREKAELSRGSDTFSAPVEEPKRPLKPKKKKSDNRVQVVVLNDMFPSIELEQTGVQFKQNQLFGTRVKRDHCMLQTSRVSAV